MLTTRAPTPINGAARHELLDDLLEGYSRAVAVWAAGQTGPADAPTAAQPP
jgi:hypothetical protein